MKEHRTVRTGRVAWMLAIVATVQALVACGAPAAEPPSIDPTTWLAPEWEQLLGSDPSGPDDIGVDLMALQAASDVPSNDAPLIESLVRDVALAEAAWTARSVFGDYFPRNHQLVSLPAAPTEQAAIQTCTDVSVAATSSFVLPVSPIGSFVKALVAWSGTCPFPPVEAGIDPATGKPVYLTAVYVAQADAVARASLDARRYGNWIPVRPLAIPGTASATVGGYVAPPAWELVRLEQCVIGEVVVHIEVAAAYTKLCAAAQADGVALEATSGLRSFKEQAALYNEALDYFVDPDQAKLHVAAADAYHCESTHCAGEAIDVTGAALEWLLDPVGCLTADRIVAPLPCATGDATVRRLEQYGFTNPIRSSPTHLEYALGTLNADVDLYGDCTPGPVSVQARIAAIVRCRVLEAGLTSADATVLSEQAVQIATCASQLDPAHKSFDGRFTYRENPSTGARDDRVGLFGLSAAVADVWLVGGAAARESVTAHIDAVARIVVEERRWGRPGWALFACATGDDGVTVPVSLVP